jgi:hypothetical protein
VILTMDETAAAVGLSYERFRKVWRRLSAERGFPAPLHGRRWDSEAVARWRAEASRPTPAPLAPASLPAAQAAAWRQLERARKKSREHFKPAEDR